MANNSIIEPDNDSFLSVPPDLNTAEGITTEASIVEISSQIQEIIRKLNGKVNLGTDENSSRAGNVDAQRITVVFAGADTERKVPHGLDRVPVGYWVVRRDRACGVYDSNETGWTESLFTLKCDTADAMVDVLVF